MSTSGTIYRIKSSCPVIDGDDDNDDGDNHDDNGDEGIFITFTPSPHYYLLYKKQEDDRERRTPAKSPRHDAAGDEGKTKKKATKSSIILRILQENENQKNRKKQQLTKEPYTTSHLKRTLNQGYLRQEKREDQNSNGQKKVSKNIGKRYKKHLNTTR